MWFLSCYTTFEIGLHTSQGWSCQRVGIDQLFTKMLGAFLNKSCKQLPTKQLQYSHLSPISLTIQVKWMRHAEHCWWSKDTLISNVLFLNSYTWTHQQGFTWPGHFGQQNTLTASLQREKTPPMSVLHMTLNNLIRIRSTPSLLSLQRSTLAWSDNTW